VTAINFDLAAGREYPYVAVGAFLFAISGTIEFTDQEMLRGTIF